MKFIYVPQGKAARLTRSQANFDIAGLYTNQFSTCNYVVLIGEDSIGLMHLDHELINTGTEGPIDQVKKEIRATNPNTVLVISRPEGNELRDYLREHLTPPCGAKLKFEEMDTEHDGIHVSFSDADTNPEWHRQVRRYARGVRPHTELLHHPSEQRMVAVQKIEQVIGLGAIANGKTPREKTLLIYGNVWQPLSESELKLDDTEPETTEELDYFQKDNSFTMIYNNLLNLMENYVENKLLDLPSEPNDMERIACSVGPYLETYLSQYSDEEVIFRRNIMDTLDFYKNRDKNSKEAHLETRLKEALNEGTHDAISLLFDEGEHIFFPDLLKEFKSLKRHYDERRSYQQLKKMQKEELTRADELKKSGLSRVLSQGADQTAIDDFSESLKRQCYYGVVDRNMVTTALFLGEALLACGHLDRARSFLRFSLAGCQAAKARDQEERINRKLQECLSASAVSTDSIIPQAAFFTRGPTTNAGAPAPLSPRSTP